MTVAEFIKALLDADTDTSREVRIQVNDGIGTIGTNIYRVLPDRVLIIEPMETLYTDEQAQDRWRE